MKDPFKSWNECIDLREVTSLIKMSHPNIVQLKEVIRKDNELYFVFEYLTRNLYEAICDRQTPFPEPVVRNILYQIFQGLAFIHRNNFFHRDMKPENLLVTGDTVKIGDFGLTKEIDSKEPLTEYVSTRWYRSPELLLRAGRYDASIDLWAVGCIMAELLTLNPLFPGETEIDELDLIFQVLGTPTEEQWPGVDSLLSRFKYTFPKYPAQSLTLLIPNASTTAISLLSSLLLYDPSARLTAADALAHSFFQIPIVRYQVNPDFTLSRTDDAYSEDDSDQNKRFNLCQHTYQNFVITLAYFFCVVFYPSHQTIKYTSNRYYLFQKYHITRWDLITYLFAMIGLTGNSIAVVAYWGFIYPHVKSSFFETLWYGVIPHGLSFVFLIVDVLFCTRITSKWIHFLLPFITTLLYFVQLLVYKLLTKRWLFVWLDFRHPAAPLAYPCIVVHSAAFHFLIVFLLKLRLRCFPAVEMPNESSRTRTLMDVPSIYTNTELAD
ncbi:putative serine/threonine protein kinase [Blattamonas nauphoetae]|uniref:Serine/threonine protein kinase n=1 Tax=Blattamonas nauphoetae TaxID=2049346 RepID=A0ABQ9YH95_9EUKA|nr:putative serine/threonine protein kinase [Blattamonas nauphoetae]